MLLGKEIEWHRHYTLEVPKPDELDEVGQRAVHQYVLDTWQLYLPGDWDWRWVVARGTYCGTLPKRVSSWLFRQHAIKATTAQMEQLGNLASKYIARSVSLEFDFDNELNWKAGDFGDEGSCYWGCYAGARVMLRGHHALAVRFFKDGQGYARAWVIPMDKYLLMYNVYGMSNAVQVQRVLSLFFNTSYSSGPIRFTNRGEASDTLYINNAQAWLVGPSSVIDDIHEVDLRWPIENANRHCARCGDIADEDELRNAPGDEAYCDDCFNEHCFVCADCENTYWRDDACTDDDGNQYCSDCYGERYLTCDRCGAEISRDDGEYAHVEGDIYCQRCVDRYAVACYGCEEYILERNATEVEGESFCEDCLDGLAQCPECQERFLNPDNLARHQEECHAAVPA